SLEIRARETAAATAALGLDWRGNLGLVNRSLVADLDARKKLASALRLLRPRVMLAHFWEDAHPDHVAASALCDAARFWTKLSNSDMPGEPFFPDRIVYYFSVHLRLHIQPSFVLDVSPYFDKKMEAVNCYHSQFVQGRATNAIADQLRTAASYWGWTIGAKYG